MGSIILLLTTPTHYDLTEGRLTRPGMGTNGWLYEPKGAQATIANKRSMVSQIRCHMTWKSIGIPVSHG